MTNKIGTTTLPTTTSRTSMVLKELFKNNPKTYYTQAELVQEYNKSNPCINKILRTLLEQGVVGRTKVNGRFYYQQK
mgnify:CR=1 FL=1